MYPQAKTGNDEVDLAFQTSLAGFATSVHVVTLVPTSPAVRMNIQGQLAYNDALATNKRLFFDTTIPTCDFIRYTCGHNVHCMYIIMFPYLFVVYICVRVDAVKLVQTARVLGSTINFN